MSSVEAGSVQVRLTADTQGAMKGFNDVVNTLKRIEAQSYKTQEAMTRAIGQATSAVIANMRNMDTTSRTTQARMQKDLVRTNKFVKDLSIRFNQAYRTLFNIKTIAVVALGGMLKSLSDVTAEAERMKASLNVMTGGRGEETFTALSSFAARTNVTTAEAVKQYTQLRAVGLQPTIEDMETLLDLTNAFGGSQAVFQRISKALGDIQAKGKLMGEEVRQLTNIGVPIRAILLESGLLAENMVDQIGKANISATKVIQAIFDYTKKNFKGITQEIMQTWAGTVERLQDTWWRWRRVVAETGFIDTLKEQIDSMINTNTGWARVLERVGSLLGELTKGIFSFGSSLDSNFGILNSFLGMLQTIGLALKTIWYVIRDVVDHIGGAFTQGLAGFVGLGKVLFGDMSFDEYTKMLGELSAKTDEYRQKQQDMRWGSGLKEQFEDILRSNPTEKTKEILGTSKELEEVLNKLSKGMQATPMTMFEELNKKITSTAQSATPKIEKMRTRLKELKDEYSSYFAKGGGNDIVLASLQEAMRTAIDPKQKEDLRLQIEEYKRLTEVMKENAKVAFSSMEKDIAKEQAKSLRESVGLFAQIEKKYDKIVGLRQTETQVTVKQVEEWGKQLNQLGLKKPQLMEDIKIAKEQLDLIKAKLEEPWTNKLADGFKLASEQLLDLGSSMEGLAKNITSTLTDAFTEFFDKGETDWFSFLQTIRQMILKTLVEQTISGPLANAMSMAIKGIGSYFSGSMGVTNVTDTASSGGNVTFTNASYPISAHADGGWINEPVYGYGAKSGRAYSFAERGSEYVSSTSSSKAMGNGSDVTVNIYGGDENTRVKQKQGQNGPEIDIYLDKKMAQLVSGGSATAKALRASYGLTQRRV